MRGSTDAAPVAAVVSVYNESEDALERTLESILAQTMQAERVVVVDDGSDRPLQIRDGIRRDVEVVPLSDNVGLAGARNRGARLTSTQYLLFLNCDVVLKPDWLSGAISFIESDSTVGAVSGTIVPVVGREILRSWRLQFLETKSHRAGLRAPTPVTWLVGHAVLVRRSVFEEVGGFDEKYRCAAEDWDISQRIRALGYSLVHVPSLIAESYELASIDRLARKNVRNAGWDIRENGMQRPCAALQPVRRLPATLSIFRLLGLGVARNLVRRRVRLLPVDIAVAVRSTTLVWRASNRSPSESV